MDITTSLWEVAIRFLIALAFGAIVGWEREAADKPAGLRTHMLVALGAAGFTLVAIELFESLKLSDGSVKGDPLRLVASVVGGVGFLGAGAIIQSRGTVVGLTTAAGLWVVAAVGVAAGCGQYWIALMMSALTAGTLTGIGWLKKKTVDHTSKLN